MIIEHIFNFRVLKFLLAYPFLWNIFMYFVHCLISFIFSVKFWKLLTYSRYSFLLNTWIEKMFSSSVACFFILFTRASQSRSSTFWFGPIYQFFLLCVTLLMSSLRPLCLALDPEISSYFFCKFTVSYFTFKSVINFEFIFT